MSKKRKQRSAAEKARIALEAIKGDQTLSELVKKYEVHATQIHKWKRHILEHLAELFTDTKKREKADHEEEICVLYEQIGRLKIEVEFLKKKSALFRE